MTTLRVDRLTGGAILLGALLALALLADRIAPIDPIRQDLSFSHHSPSRFHPMGTDRLGRDVLSRVAHGSRVTLTVGLLSACLAAVVGSIVGLASGASGGRVDRVLMRLVDVGVAFPTLILLLVLAALYRPDNAIVLSLVLGLTTWMPVARQVRGEAARLVRRPFFEAAACLGASPGRRIWRHLLPNAASTVLVSASLLAGDIVLMESGLSYLGLGVAAPTPSWGDMVRQATPHLAEAWWVAAFPGLALVVTVLTFALLGDGFSDALEPREAARVRPFHPRSTS